MAELQDVVTSLAEEHGIPGVAVAVLQDGREEHAFHGVTSIENPLPVDERTLFLCGSTTKTFTGTAIMRLVERGLVELDAPVRRYLPEFRVADEDVASTVTVLQLLNHTSGWDGDFFRNTGDGDDALARYVDAMAGLQQLTRPGEAVSYNNAAFGVAGRLVEQVTGTAYEAALRELVLEPLGLRDTLFFSRELLARRVAIDHQRLHDGSTKVLPFGFPRATNPVGGLATTTRDQIGWARFHLDGGSLVSPELLRRMREPTVEAPGWAQGDAVGISWLLSQAGGLHVVGHGGATLGQLSLFKTVPERRFALVSCTNCGPAGSAFNERIMAWAWESLLDAPIPEPETAARNADEVAPYCGRYETVANVIDVSGDGAGIAVLVADRPEVLEELGAPDLEQEPPVPFRFRADQADRIVCTTPPHRGSTGFFVRNGDGRVTALNAFGRHAVRTG